MKARAYLGIPRDLIPWSPKIDSDHCIGCGECLNTCPNNVFVLNETEKKITVANPTNCVVLCDKCAGFCPEEAIEFPNKDEFKKLLQRLLEELREKARAETPTSRQN